MQVSLLYVSKSTLKASEEAGEVGDIVQVAQSRNAALGVTGALVLARGSFAQVLEGERAAVDELMISILADKRHKEVNVVQIEEIERRRFDRWSLAYIGASTYVDTKIAPLLPVLQEAGSRSEASASLVALMHSFLQPV